MNADDWDDSQETPTGYSYVLGGRMCPLENHEIEELGEDYESNPLEDTTLTYDSYDEEYTPILEQSGTYKRKRSRRTHGDDVEDNRIPEEDIETPNDRQDDEIESSAATGGTLLEVSDMACIDENREDTTPGSGSISTNIQTQNVSISQSTGGRGPKRFGWHKKSV